MSINNRGSTTTARSTMELECTRWPAGVQKWANMVKSSEKMLARQVRANTTSIALVMMAKGAAEMANTMIVEVVVK